MRLVLVVPFVAGLCSCASSSTPPPAVPAPAEPARAAGIKADFHTQDILQLLPDLPIRFHADVTRFKQQMPDVARALARLVEADENVKGAQQAPGFFESHLTELCAAAEMKNDEVEFAVSLRADSPFPFPDGGAPNAQGFWRSSVRGDDWHVADARTVVVSSTALRTQVETRLADPAPSNSHRQISGLVQFDQAAVSFVAELRPNLMSGLATSLKIPALSEAVRGLRAVGGYLETGPQPMLHVVALSDSERSAGILAGLAAITVQATAADTDEPELAALLRRISIRADGAAIRADLPISRQQILQWLKRVRDKSDTITAQR